jgi:hypothetical protein
MFKDLGFANVRTQEFDTPYWVRGLERAEVTSPFPQALTVTALGGSVSTGEQGVAGEIVILPALKALKAQADGALAGKIVFIDEVMARTQDGSGYGVAVQKRTEAAYEARRAGAVAALIRSVGTSSHRFAHTGQMHSARRTPYPDSVPAAALSAPDADQLARMAKRGQPIRVKLVLTPEMRPPAVSGNVIAEIPGREAPQEIVLVGAHLDSWDLGTGAVDDGAGVAIVTAAARLLASTQKQAPRRTIRVVLFGAEENGLIGAKHYADSHKDELDRHIFAAESDFGADLIWRFASGNVAEGKLPLVKAIQEILAPLGVVPGNNSARGGPDLYFLHGAGVPVADLRQNGRDYFDLHHTPNDTLDKIDPEKLKQNVAVYAAFLSLVANMEEDFK